MVTRQRAVCVRQRDQQLLPRQQQLKANHPWGYRRIWVYLMYRERLWASLCRSLHLAYYIW
jgi:hypothetical protein